MRNIKHLPPTPKTPRGYATWRRDVLAHRLLVLQETSERNPNHRENRQREVDRCRADRLYLAAVYGTIYEARPDESGDDRKSGYLPWIPYPFQVQVWEWFDQRMQARGNLGDGLIPKSREMGLSNIAMFWVATKWAIDTPFQARVASRVADLVDVSGDPDSLFWKLDTFLQGLPRWLLTALVPGFNWKKHRKSMHLINPRNGNTVRGESTTANLGRGGRASVIIYDEAAFMDNFGIIWTAGRASSRHRIAISTVNIANGMDFYNIHHGKGGYAKPATLEVPWNAHPDHDQAWFQGEIERDTPEAIRREVLMDYFAGTGEWVYPESHGKEVGSYPYEPYAGPIFGAIDDGFDDEWCIHLIQYNVKTGRHRLLETYRNKHQKVDFYGSLMTGVPRSDIRWGEKEYAFAKLCASMPGITWVGDPHIANREQITGMSVFEHFAANWNIYILYDMDVRNHVDRRVALSHIIPVLDFNDTPDVSYALEALKRNRYPKSKEGSERQTEAKNPIHDDTSHPTTALEWYAVNFEQFKSIFSQRQVQWDGEPNI